MVDYCSNIVVFAKVHVLNLFKLLISAVLENFQDKEIKKIFKVYSIRYFNDTNFVNRFNLNGVRSLELKNSVATKVVANKLKHENVGVENLEANKPYVNSNVFDTLWYLV